MRKQAGFTLIELIMVIVILGVLSAFALPRFADLGGEARRASIDGALGAVRSAANIAHAQWLADGNAAATVVLDGVTIDMVGGWPDADGDAPGGNNTIAEAAQLSNADYTITQTAASTVMVVGLGTCTFTYDEDDGSVTAITGADANGDC